MTTTMNDKIKRMTAKKCQEWALKPTVNPISGATIDPDAPTGVYRKIAERCAKFGITPSNVPLHTQRLPRTVGGYHVPQNKDELPEFIDLLKNAITAFELSEGNIPDDHRNHEVRDGIHALVKIVKLIRDVGYITAEPPSQAAIVAKFIDVYDRRIMYSDPEPLESVANDLRDEFNHILVRPSRNAHHLMKDFLCYVFKYKFLSLPESPVFKDAKQFYDLIIQFHKQNENVNRERGEVAAFSISESKSRSLPGSISQERYVTRRLKPKQRFITRTVEIMNPDTGRPETHTVRVPDPSEPDTFIENVFYDDPSIDREVFRRHSKLSAMSPHKYPEVNRLTPLPQKERVQLLNELRQERKSDGTKKPVCNEMQDNITGKRFDRMNKKNLQLIVKIGKQPHRCYYARSIYKLWQEAAKHNLPFVDPETRIPITNKEKNDIMSKIRYVNPSAIRPDDRSKLKRDPHLTLEFVPEGAFYRITIKYNISEHSVTMYNLGCIPATIELEDVGAANLTSAAVVGSLQTLFDEGRLMASNFVPFSCCRIHLSKTIQYWTTPTINNKKQRDGTNVLDAAGNVVTEKVPLVNGINMERWKLMASEVYGLL